MGKWLDLFQKKLTEITSDDDRRLKLQYISTYIILGVVSLFMTIVNVCTYKIALMWSTLIFAVLCAKNVALGFRNDRCLHLSSWFMRIEILLLMAFFIISGTPEGFSAIWAALIPSCSLLLFKRKHGTIMSAVMLAIIIFLFWTPFGRSLLQFEYTQSFRLRFPMLYCAFYALAFFFESIRMATFANYEFMCSHDTLTMALNRRGFAANAAKALAEGSGKAASVGFIIVDLDLFKRVNDTYGHFVGDEVLKLTAERLEKVAQQPVCRWGGEEFAILFPQGLSETVCENLKKAFDDEPLRTSNNIIRQTVSIGAVNVPFRKDIDINDLCRAADKCLYEAKETGRDKYVLAIENGQSGADLL